MCIRDSFDPGYHDHIGCCYYDGTIFHGEWHKDRWTDEGRQYGQGCSLSLIHIYMFGDILSDEASMVTGSIGLLPSASIGDTAPGLYEPIHGSAPDIAGQDKANPIATILSVGMMFRYSFHLPHEADAIEQAVDAVLAEGWRTQDIAKPGEQTIGTVQMGELIRRKL